MNDSDGDSIRTDINTDGSPDARVHNRESDRVAEAALIATEPLDEVVSSPIDGTPTPPVKRGRGRPRGSGSGPKPAAIRKVAIRINGSREPSMIIDTKMNCLQVDQEIRRRLTEAGVEFKTVTCTYADTADPYMPKGTGVEAPKIEGISLEGMIAEDSVPV